MSRPHRVAVASREDVLILEYWLNRFLRNAGLELERLPAAARVLAVAASEAGSRADFSFGFEGEDVVLEFYCADPGVLLNPTVSKVMRKCDERVVEYRCGSARVKMIFHLPAGKKREQWRCGRACKPHYLQTVSGDLCLCRPLGETLLVAVVDVLGHGARAHRVASLIEEYLQNCKEGYLPNIYEGVESLVRDTRGCALFLGIFHKEELNYLGVGNVRAWLLNGNTIKALPTAAGVVGKKPVRNTVLTEPLSEEYVLIACTDGIKRWFLPQDMPWITTLEPEAVAEKILNQYSIKEDDASVLVVRRESS